MVQGKPLWQVDQFGNVRRRFGSVADVLRAEGMLPNSRGGLLRAIHNDTLWHGTRWCWGTAPELDGATASDGSAMHDGGGGAASTLTGAVKKIKRALDEANQGLDLVRSIAIISEFERKEGIIGIRTNGTHQGTRKRTRCAY